MTVSGRWRGVAVSGRGHDPEWEGVRRCSVVGEGAVCRCAWRDANGSATIMSATKNVSKNSNFASELTWERGLCWWEAGGR